jgi:hypothetical protein
LVFEEKLAYPLLQGSQTILPRFFENIILMFVPRDGEGCTHQAPQRRNGVDGRLIERLLILLGSHNISNANRRRGHDGVFGRATRAIILTSS